MYKVIDNYLPKSYHKEIKNLLAGSDFPWFYNQDISYPDDTGTTRLNEYGFNHHFYTYAEDGSGGQRDGFEATFIKPFLLMLKDTVGCDMILRCRGDMVTWSSDEEFIHPAHIDFNFPNTSTIFYVNDTDGDTLLYGKNSFKDGKIDQDRFGTLSQTIGSETTTLEIKERISPKANRLVMYDGSLLHTGSSPTKHKTRILINSNFRKSRIGQYSHRMPEFQVHQE
jgi:hypothetical protein